MVTPQTCTHHVCLCACVQDYDTFFNAKEDNTVFAFLGLPPPPVSKVRLFFFYSAEIWVSSSLCSSRLQHLEDSPTVKILHDWMTLCFKTIWLIYWSCSGGKKPLIFCFGCMSSSHAWRPITRFQSSNIPMTSFPGVFSEMPVWMHLFEVVFWFFYTLLWWQEAQQAHIVENGTHTEGANGSADDPTVNPLSLFFPSHDHECPLACSIQPSQPLMSHPWLHPYSLNLRVLIPMMLKHTAQLSLLHI